MTLVEPSTGTDVVTKDVVVVLSTVNVTVRVTGSNRVLVILVVLRGRTIIQPCCTGVTI